MSPKPKLPRVMVPSRKNGAHRTRRNELPRKAKHKGRDRAEVTTD